MRNAICAVALVCVGCYSIPETHHYALPSPVAKAGDRSATAPLIAVDALAIDAAYEEQSIVYRPSPHRIERYHYHRWGAPPALMVTDYLRDSLAVSGCFRAVLDEVHPDTVAVLSGRVIAIEEVDVTEKEWQGRLTLELRLVDPESSALLWSRRFHETERLDEQSPAGLANALGRALARIAAQSVPEILAVVGAEREVALRCGVEPVPAAAMQ